MIPFGLTSDRIIDSTDNNEYADGDRDETFWEKDMADSYIPDDDIVSDILDEINEGRRPEYSEDGFREDIGE